MSKQLEPCSNSRETILSNRKARRLLSTLIQIPLSSFPPCMRTPGMPRPQRAKLSMVLQRLMRTTLPSLLFRHFLPALYQCIALLHQPELRRRQLLLVSQLYPQWHLPPPLHTLAPPLVQTLHTRSTLLPLHPTLQEVRPHPKIARQSTTSVRTSRVGNVRTSREISIVALPSPRVEVTSTPAL